MHAHSNTDTRSMDELRDPAVYQATLYYQAMMSECEIPPNADAQPEEDDSNDMDNEPDEHVNRVDHQDAAEPEELEYADPLGQDAGLEGLGK